MYCFDFLWANILHAANDSCMLVTLSHDCEIKHTYWMAVPIHWTGLLELNTGLTFDLKKSTHEAKLSMLQLGGAVKVLCWAWPTLVVAIKCNVYLGTAGAYAWGMMCNGTRLPRRKMHLATRVYGKRQTLATVTCCGCSCHYTVSQWLR